MFRAAVFLCQFLYQTKNFWTKSHQHTNGLKLVRCVIFCYKMCVKLVEEQLSSSLTFLFAMLIHKRRVLWCLRDFHCLWTGFCQQDTSLPTQSLNFFLAKRRCVIHLENWCNQLALLIALYVRNVCLCSRSISIELRIWYNAEESMIEIFSL